MGNIVVLMIVWGVSSAGAAAAFAWWVQAGEKRTRLRVIALRSEFERRPA